MVQESHKSKIGIDKITLNMLPVMLDIRDLKEALVPDVNRHNNRLIAPFKDYAGTCEAFFRRDRDKVAEILSKLDTAHANSLSAPLNGAGKSAENDEDKGDS